MTAAAVVADGDAATGRSLAEGIPEYVSVYVVPWSVLESTLFLRGGGELNGKSWRDQHTFWCVGVVVKLSPLRSQRRIFI